MDNISYVDLALTTDPRSGPRSFKIETTETSIYISAGLGKFIGISYIDEILAFHYEAGTVRVQISEKELLKFHKNNKKNSGSKLDDSKTKEESYSCD